MANQKHLDILKQKVYLWNEWREKNPNIKPNLGGANLREANLREARLLNADLARANLGGTDLEKAKFNYTLLSELDLSLALNLEKIQHLSYSYLYSSTIIQSKGKLPIEFLRGCGLSDWEIESTKLYNKDLTEFQIGEVYHNVIEIRTGPAIHYSSCFISYSSLNQHFANKVHDKLQNTGVRCWFDKKSLKPGDKLRKTITESIRIHDRLLLVLSNESINAPWVKYEVEKALDREQKEDRNILFPILLEDLTFTGNNWMEDIPKEIHYLDFRNWQDESYWNQSFEKLLQYLKN